MTRGEDDVLIVSGEPAKDVIYLMRSSSGAVFEMDYDEARSAADDMLALIAKKAELLPGFVRQP